MKIQAFDNQAVYDNAVASLHVLIVAKYGSVNRFCKEHKIDRFNLSRVFSEDKAEEMGVGLYIRICVGLGLMDPANIAPDVYAFRISLRHYLMIDNNMILKSLLTVNQC